MNLSKIFPTYPVQIISPRGGNVKIASRRVYVDFPYVFWSFIGDLAQKINKSESPQEIFQKELEVFNSDENVRKITTFNDIPLGSISLITTPFTAKLLLKLKVNWNMFFQYLESKAENLVSEVEKDSSNIRNVYNEIINNYYNLVTFVPRPEIGRFNNYTLENFKKLLRKLQEEQDIQRSLLILKLAIESIGEATESEGIKLWTLQLESDVYGIESCLESMEILSCYFYLRNALEHLVKLVVYNDIVKSFNIHDELLQIFFFYERNAKGKSYSIQQLKSKYEKNIVKYLRDASQIDPEKIYQMMVDKRLPKLVVNTQTLEEFQKMYSIEVPIKNYWSACSEIIHNQTPLPFFSLLEVKFFKYFLMQYVEGFISVIKVFAERDAQINVMKFGTTPLIDKELLEEKIAKRVSIPRQKLSKNARGVLRQLIFQREEEIKAVLKSVVEDKTLKREILFDPLILASLFYLYSPGITRITSEEFGIDDIEYFIKKIQPLTFKPKGSLEYMFFETLHIFEEKVIPKLEYISSDFSKLNEEEKKDITFYLLAIELPELFFSKVTSEEYRS